MTRYLRVRLPHRMPACGENYNQLIVKAFAPALPNLAKE
jgi:hypothetical protein